MRFRFANDTETDLTVSMDDFSESKKGKRVAWGWGDGTVPLVSLAACARWSNVTVRRPRVSLKMC